MGAWLSITMLLAAVGPPGGCTAGVPSSRPTYCAGPGTSKAVHPSASFSIKVSARQPSRSAQQTPIQTPVDAGSSTASVSWSEPGFFNTGAWSLTVQASLLEFQQLSDGPGLGHDGILRLRLHQHWRLGTCSQPFALSTSAQTVAGGNQALLTYSYASPLNFTLADNWKYIAETSPSCSLSLSYIATVP